MKHASAERIALLLGVILFIIALAFGMLEHEHEEAAHNQLNIFNESWMNLIFAVVSLIVVWFIATAPKDEFDRIVAANPEILDEWDEECGDRMTKLVFIGRHMDKDALIAGLDDCLVPWVH